MQEISLKYSFEAKVWKYDGPAGWYFADAPRELSKEIRKLHQDSEEGWGRLKALVSVKETTWKTSIWFDTKRDCFLVPFKAEIRKKEGITDGSIVAVDLEIELF